MGAMHGDVGGGGKEHSEDVAAIALSIAQLFTIFIAQAALMDRTLFSASSFTIPTSSVSVFAALNPLLLVPLYEFLTMLLLRRLIRHPSGLTSLQHIGAGLFVSVLALIAAGAGT